MPSIMRTMRSGSFSTMVTLFPREITTDANSVTTNKRTRTIKVSETTESLRSHYKSRSHGKDCLKRWLFKRLYTVNTAASRWHAITGLRENAGCEICRCAYAG